MAESDDIQNVLKKLKENEEEIKKAAGESGSSSAKEGGSGTSGSEAGKKSGESGQKNENGSGGLSSLGQAAKNLQNAFRSSDKPEEKPAQQSSTSSHDMSSKISALRGESDSEAKKELMEMVNKKMSSKFSELSAELGKLGKINDLEAKLSQLTDRINTQMLQPPMPASAPGEAASTGRQLASFGEEVDFQSQMFDLKKSISEVTKKIEMMEKKLDYRVSNLEDKSKVLERLPDMEERYEQLNQKLGPDNVQKLRRLIFSSDEIVEQVIPDLVNKRLKTKLDPAVNEVRDLRDSVNDFNVKLNHIKEEVLNLQKLREDIAELRSDKDHISKEMEDQEERLSDGVEGLREDFKKKIEKVTERVYQDLKDMQKKDLERIDKDIHKTFLSLIQPRFAELEKRNMLLEERIKIAEKRDSELYDAVKSIEAPENIKKWLDKRMYSLERGLQSDVKRLKIFSEKQVKTNEGTRDSVNTIWSELKGLPRRIDNQDIAINKFIDSRDMIMKRAETMDAEISGLTEKLAMNRENISAVSQRLAAQESRFGEILNGQKDSISKISDALKKELKGEISDIKKEMDKRREVESRKQEMEFRSEMKRLATIEEEIKTSKKVAGKSIERLDDEVAKIKEAVVQNNTLFSRVTDSEKFIGELEKKFSSMIQYQKQRLDEISDALQSSVDRKIKELSKESEEKRMLDRQEHIAQLKAEFKRLSEVEQLLQTTRTAHESRIEALRNDLNSLQNALTDIKILKERTDELGDISKAFDSRMDVDREKMGDQINRIVGQISLVDKQIKEIRALYGMLEGKINLDMKELEKALKQNMDDRKGLERDVREQRERMSALIKELSS